MADETPTKEGQNIIIKNLSSIFMTLMGLLIAYLFNWASTVSKESNENKVVIQSLKDELTRLEAKQDGQIRGVKASVEDVQSDVNDLKSDAEHVHDDLKMRTIKVEDWQKFYEIVHPLGKR